MKTRLFLMLFILMQAVPVSAETIVQKGIIGEGLPVFEAKKNSLQLYQEHSQTSKKIQIPVKSKQKIKFDLSKLITKVSVPLVTKKMVELDCNNEINQTMPPVVVQKNETLDFLTWLSEGFISVRYKNKICTVDGTDNSLFNGLHKQPVVEWWIRVIDAKKKPLGWLLIDDKKGQVVEVDRQM